MISRNLLVDSNKLKILTSFDLKIIALLTMVIDHAGFIFFPDVIEFRIIGRIAFILYAFMLVEGCFYTSNMNNYIKKIIIWAIISEVPYDLAIYNKFFYIESQNIFFTLLIGVLGIKVFKKNKNTFLNVIFAALGVLVGYLIKADYSWYGVITIYAFYFFKNLQLFKFSFIQITSILAIISVTVTQMFAFVGFLPIWLYNGKLGKKTGNWYYSFYAAHLFVFYLLKNI